MSPADPSRAPRVDWGHPRARSNALLHETNFHSADSPDTACNFSRSGHHRTPQPLLVANRSLVAKAGSEGPILRQFVSLNHCAGGHYLFRNSWRVGKLRHGHDSLDRREWCAANLPDAQRRHLHDEHVAARASQGCHRPDRGNASGRRVRKLHLQPFRRWLRILRLNRRPSRVGRTGPTSVAQPDHCADSLPNRHFLERISSVGPGRAAWHRRHQLRADLVGSYRKETDTRSLSGSVHSRRRRPGLVSQVANLWRGRTGIRRST